MTEHRVRAVNTAAASENKIHSDEVAAQYGFRGGLVPGVAVYGYMAAPVIEALGLEWLKRGTMTARFLQPFYEDEWVTSQFDGAKVVARNDEGTECAVGSAALAANGVTFYPIPEAPLPEPRREAIDLELNPGRVFGTLHTIATDPVTPHYLLGLANDVFVRNYNLGPWIHTASDVRNLRAIAPGDSLQVRARVAEQFERKGHQLVTLDVVILANGEPAQIVRHTAIYRLRAPTH